MNAIKQITDTNEIEAIIASCKICRIAMIDGELPYLLAFNFGYRNQTIYIHTGKTGKKLDVLAKNNKVCVLFDTDHELFFRNQPVACSWRQRYRSVMAHGKAVKVEDFEQKTAALNIFMQNYAEQQFTYSTPAINNIEVFEIKIERMTGRSFEY